MSRRPPIPGGQPHRDQKNDYVRSTRAKMTLADFEQYIKELRDGRGQYLPSEPHQIHTNREE